MQQNRTELETLGEFGLIKHLTQYFVPKHPTTVRGVGDDAAIIAPEKRDHVVVTTDMLVEGVHFDLIYTPLKHLGYKSIVVNLSDVYAMNAIPTQLTVSLAVSNRFSLEALEELYSGIQKACDWYGVDLVGGDTTSSRSGLVLSITAIGMAAENRIVTRAGAREHDLLVVSGDLGSAYMGLQVLEREKEVFRANPQAQPDLAGFDYILERQLKPEARKDIIELLQRLDIKPTAMIDISDGLASEILHIADQSLVGCDLYEDKIPIDPGTIKAAMDFGLDPTTVALSGGEDYELLFTIRQSDYEKMKGNPSLTVIGHITLQESGCNLVTRSGTLIPLTAQGWNAFHNDSGG
ncbi:MAG: thiamine-phosphate kinase [Crocinitomicaceae bacterium]|nr:thiamine-phosphate kinase [Crocinitomicaceae bacterium]